MSNEYADVVKQYGTVLVVDDCSEDRYLAARAFKSLGHDVLTASNPQEALNLGLFEVSDIVYSDTEMGKFHGPDFCEVYLNAGNIVIGASNSKNPKIREAWERARAHGFVEKGTHIVTSPEEVIPKAVLEAIRIHRQQEQYRQN